MFGSCIAAAEQTIQCCSEGEVIPYFLQTTREQWKPTSSEHRAVQATKEREVEHVRCRATATHVKDLDLECLVQIMCTDVDIKALLVVAGSAITSSAMCAGGDTQKGSRCHKPSPEGEQAFGSLAEQNVDEGWRRAAQPGHRPGSLHGASSVGAQW